MLIDLVSAALVRNPEETRRRSCERPPAAVPGLGGTRICSWYPPTRGTVTMPFGVPTSTVDTVTPSAFARLAAASGAVRPPWRAPSEISSTVVGGTTPSSPSGAGRSAPRAGSRRRVPCPRPTSGPGARCGRAHGQRRRHREERSAAERGRARRCTCSAPWQGNASPAIRAASRRDGLTSFAFIERDTSIASTTVASFPRDGQVRVRPRRADDQRGQRKQ